MRTPSEEATLAGPGVPEDVLPTIVARFDEQIADLAVVDRNDRRVIADARDRTVDWYDRNLHARTGRRVGAADHRSLVYLLDRQAPVLVAGRNADQLVGDLTRLEADLPGSGLGVREERRLLSEIDSLRRDLRREGCYLRDHDDAVVRIASVVKRAEVAWAENHLVVLERYLGRDRWWLR